MTQSLLWLSLTLYTGGAAILSHATEEVATVAVASSLRELWPALAEQFVSDTGNRAPSASFGSSGLLGSQIAHGAPFELFLSADRASLDRLQAAGLALSPKVTFALGRLALVSPLPAAIDAPVSGSPPDDTWQQWVSKVHPKRSFRLAIANPRHAPYGMAAREALQSAGLWPLPPASLLQAENATQSLQFLLTGAADFAIVANSLLHPVQGELAVTPLPVGSYQAVEHSMVLLPGSGSAAQAFHDWMQTPAASNILSYYGLEPAS